MYQHYIIQLGARMGIKLMALWTVLALSQLLACVDAFSKIPTEFRNSTWYSNVHGDVTFTTLQMRDWTVDINGPTNVNWLVMDDTRYRDNKGYIIFRSETNYTIDGTMFYAYMCTFINRLYDNLYIYHSIHAQESRFGGERVLLLEAPSIDVFTTVCNVVFVPSPDDINMLARKGSDSFTTCPIQLRDRIGFTAQTTNTSALCAGVNNMADGCTDKTRINITSTCNYPLLFSANGSLSCLTELPSGNDGIVYLLNMDSTVDNVNTFRYSCMAISGDGTILSVVPQRCLTGHSSTTFPPLTNGQRLFVKTRAVCSAYVITEFDETKSMWIRIGIPVGVMILFLITCAICAVVVCSRIRRKQMGIVKDRRDSFRSNNGPRKRQVVIIEKVKPKSTYGSPYVKSSFENPYVTADEMPMKAIEAGL